MRYCLLIALLCLFAPATLRAGEVDLTAKPLAEGEKAPALNGVEWLKGTPVDPAAGKITVLAFWTGRDPSTGRIFPLLDSIAKENPEVAVAGLTKDPAEKIKPMLDKMEIAFSLGADAEGKAIAAYMAGAPGLPYSVVVGKDGTVKWKGHPLSSLKEVVAALKAGTFDAAKFKEIETLQMELQQTMQAVQQNQASPAQLLSVVDKLIVAQPANSQWYNLKIQIYKRTRVDSKIPEVFLAWEKNVGEDPSGLVSLAASMMEMSPDSIDPAMAVKAAKKAWALDQGKSPNVGLGVARVYEEVGLFDKAIEVCEATKAATDDPKMQEGFSKYIGYLNKLKAARALIQ